MGTDQIFKLGGIFLLPTVTYAHVSLCRWPPLLPAQVPDKRSGAFATSLMNEEMVAQHKPWAGLGLTATFAFPSRVTLSLHGVGFRGVEGYRNSSPQDYSVMANYMLFRSFCWSVVL